MGEPRTEQQPSRRIAPRFVAAVVALGLVICVLVVAVIITRNSGTTGQTPEQTQLPADEASSAPVSSNATQSKTWHRVASYSHPARGTYEESWKSPQFVVRGRWKVEWWIMQLVFGPDKSSENNLDISIKHDPPLPYMFQNELFGNYLAIVGNNPWQDDASKLSHGIEHFRASTAGGYRLEVDTFRPWRVEIWEER